MTPLVVSKEPRAAFERLRVAEGAGECKAAVGVSLENVQIERVDVGVVALVADCARAA